MGEILDESMVEIGESKEGLQLLLGGQDWPLCNPSNFGRVHLDRIMGNDHPEVFHLGPLKLALVTTSNDLGNRQQS